MTTVLSPRGRDNQARFQKIWNNISNDQHKQSTRVWLGRTYINPIHQKGINEA
jgi:hypothetical protein